MNKGCFIEEITEGATVNGLFLVKTMTRAETRAGKPYLSLLLADRSGEITARVWDNADELQQFCPRGGFVSITGQAQSYREILQLKVTRIEAVPAEKVDLSLFVPVTRNDIDAMWRELRQWIDDLGDGAYRDLLRDLFADEQLADNFKKAPAAKHMHHAYLGGLLEHTLAIVRLADAVCRFYPDVDRDLLMAGAILHDIGKVVEFSYDTPPFDYSERGRLEGHLVLGVEFINDRIKALDNFDERRASLLRHLILSHHGRHEFGAPTVPMTIEAFILNLLDDLDAKANYIHRLAMDAGEDYQWTDYQKPLERFLLVKKPADACYTTAPGNRQEEKTTKKPGRPEPPINTLQPSLFD